MHHFQSDFINNMDQMHISGTALHQWSLTKQSRSKSWKVMSLSAKTRWSEKRWCKNQQNYKFNQFEYGTFWWESIVVDRRTWLGVPSKTLWFTSTHQIFEIQKETSTKIYAPFSIGFNQQYEPYANLVFWNTGHHLIADNVWICTVASY